MLARHEKPEAGRSGVAPAHVKDIAGQALTRPLAQQVFEVLALPQPVPRVKTVARRQLARLRHQPAPPARATVAQHRSAAAGAAAREKTVAPRAAQLGRLVGSLHRCRFRKRAVLEPAPRGVVKCFAPRFTQRAIVESAS